MASDTPQEIPSLKRYACERDALLGRIVQALEGDNRVSAVWLSGSFGRGEADEWSDFDLHVAVQDEHFSAFLLERPALYRRVGTPILVQPERIPSNSMPGGHFQLVLYTGPIEVDWNIGPTSQAQRPAATTLLVNRADIPILTPPPLTPAERQAQANHWLSYFWAMTPIAIKYAGRGASRQAASQIDLLTTAFIALWRLVELPDGPNPWLPTTNRPLEPDLNARLPHLGWTIDPAETLRVIRALCAEVERLHPALTALGVSIPVAMLREIATLSAIAEEAIRAAPQDVRRTYR
ncbi:MAG: nucleotidyltransferase domain-containing protein [Thermomicrobiales bacterium]